MINPKFKNYADSTLTELERQWGDYVARHEENRQVDQLSGGLMERAYRLFKPDFDYELADSVSDSIKQLSKDWNFLNVLVRSIRKWSDADKLMKQAGRNSARTKINTVGNEIVWDHITATDFGKKYSFNWPKKMSILLGDCRRKTDELLKEEIREALEHLSILTFHVHCPNDSFWGTFMDFVKKNLQRIKDADDGSLDKEIYVICDELQLIQGYLQGVGQRIVSSKFLENHAFVTHVASVVLRISNQCCRLWFNRKDTEIATSKAIGFVDLHHQIDPRNPEFLKLIIRFQEALYNDDKSKTSATKSRKYDTERLDKDVGYFCIYILNSCSYKDIQKKLRSLVTLFLITTLKKSLSSREDVHCLFEELDPMLAEAAFLHRVHGKKETEYRCSYLVAKICILEAELFLKEQLSTITSSMPSRDDQFSKVIKVLKNLRGVTKGLCHEETECGKQNSVLTRELNDEVQSLCVSLQSKRLTNSMVKHSLLQLVYKIVFFKAESFLSGLLLNSQNDESFLANGKDQIESFVVELKYLKRVVTNQLVRKLPGEEIVFIQIEAVARRVSHLSYYNSNTDKFKQVLHSLPYLFNKVKDIKAKLEEVSSSFPVSSFPKTFEHGFIDFLGRNIMEVLKYDPESIAPVKHQLVEARSHLESFKSFLIKVSDSDFLEGEIYDLRTRIRDLAYKLEYVVESVEVDGHLEHSLWLYDLLEDIRLVNKQASSISETSSAVKFINPPRVSGELISKDTTSAINEMMVDLVEDEETVINQLTRGSLQRVVVSIVGMPGIGKTTLARKVYNNQSIMYKFPRRAWCTVSQVYSKRELLLDILSDLQGMTAEIQGMTDDDLQLKLHRCLLRNKYLIVLDDVWDIAAWNELKISFPDDGYGSRILITSRLRNVHSEINPRSDPHLIRLFSDEESWMLLEKRIFKSVGCPTELLLVGKQIAEHCQGLPLAVVAIAGVLRKTEKTRDSWEKISKSLSSLVINDQDPENRCKEILELSYKHLPEHLKPCFLYLGVFLEDKDISVSNLTEFWMAEGFIQETEAKSLEDVAQDYLMELINRSLVIISQKRSNGKVKAFQLHDLLRDLCHAKAKDENFFI